MLHKEFRYFVDRGFAYGVVGLAIGGTIAISSPECGKITPVRIASQSQFAGLVWPDGVDALPQDTNWQPISTAPKDRKVLISGLDRSHLGGKFVAVSQWQDNDWLSYEKLFFTVTDWMPAPEPPPDPSR